MGIPRFYRWLSERYPRINQRVEENVELLPEFDNMYLDANGIIHTCSHPNDEDVTSVRLTMEDMAMNMMGYIDNMVKIIRPQKVLFVAVDGCAPRAKMNQQRSRRFAAARDSEESTKKAIELGEMTPEEASQRFDSNVITPGTPFMAELSKHFEFFLRKKLKEDPLWQHLEIVYSGHDVPGEGEHKIMEYIRRTRAEPGYNPNTRHCLCGLDADLMMLGLATHEPHFSLLREEVNFNGFANKQNRNATKEVKEQISMVKWQLLRISTLRDYMALEYAPVKAEFPGLDFERVVDDWVLMVMLVGNDFLPHIPTMDIFEGALDSLIKIHKELVVHWKGHMTSADGKLHWDRVETLFKRLGMLESVVFSARETERREKDRRQRKIDGVAEDEEEEAEDDDLLNDDDEELLNANDDLWSAEDKAKQKRRKLNYYAEKFGIPTDDPAADMKIANIVSRYVEGLDWVYNYYYQGVPSWIWFYPFHFAPLASDVKNLVEMTNKFKHILGEPFKPFSQLLGCLPASSAHCLPLPYQRLMRDPTSPLKNFYPTEWEVDQNGKRNPWEWVNLLPFIDERKLAEAVSKIDPKELTEEERARNEFGKAHVYKRDLSNTARLDTTLKKLTSVEQCLSSKREFVYHSLTSKHSPNLLPGYHPLPGDSSLFVHPLLSHTASGLYLAKLNTFGTQSRKETFVLRFKMDERVPKTPQEIKQFVEMDMADKAYRLWVNYPHLHEAQVTKVIDVFGNLYDAETKQWREMTGGEKKTFDFEAMTAASKALGGDKLVGTGGIELDRVFMMFRVRLFLGMKQDLETGVMRQYFSEVEDETWIPFHLVLFKNDLADPRFFDAPALPLDQRYPLETRVLCLAEKGYGMLGTVVGIENTKVQARFPSKQPKQNEFGHLVAGTILDNYTNLTRIAQGLNLLPVVVDKFLGSLKVIDLLPREKGRIQVVDLGLNLRVGKNRVVPGYARCRAPDAVSAAWKSHDAVVRVIGGFEDANTMHTDTRNLSGDTFEYTDRAIELLLKYKAKFPRLFDRVSKKPNENEYRKADLFNVKEHPDEPDLLMTWLRQIPTYGIPLVPTSSKFMSRQAILAVQKGADEHVKAELAPSAEVTVTLPPYVLARPPSLDRGAIESPTSDLAPALGDRVCNLGNTVIPFGLKGTVIAVHPSTAAVQVVFDLPFVGGTSLSGMCRPLYGALMPASQILNLSKKVPIPLEGRPVVVRKATPVRATSATIERPSRSPMGGQEGRRSKSPAREGKVTSQDKPESKLSGGKASKPAQAFRESPVKLEQSPTKMDEPVPSTLVPQVVEAPTTSVDDVDSLGKYFKDLMAAKLSKPSTESKTKVTVESTKSASVSKVIEIAKREPSASSPAPFITTKQAQLASPMLSPGFQPENHPSSGSLIAPGHGHPPLMVPHQPSMLGSGPGYPMMMPPPPMMQPGFIPHSFILSNAPGSIPPSTREPEEQKPAPSATSAKLDSVFKRAFMTENRVFEE